MYSVTAPNMPVSRERSVPNNTSSMRIIKLSKITWRKRLLNERLSIEVKLFPNGEAFAAVGANIYLLTATHQRFSELPVVFILPYLPERFVLKIPQLMCGVFIESARHYPSV